MNTYVGTFTFLTSLIYHCTDALKVKSFYLTPTQWHKLDNIGSVLSMIQLLIYLMDNLHRNSLGELESRHEAKIDRHLTYCAMILTITMQTQNPWDIFNTYFPILIYLVIFIWKIKQRRPRLSAVMFRKGMSLMSIAVVFFIFGLNDEFDYCRIFHGLWHFTASMGLFYLLQCVDKDKPDSHLQLARLDKMERLSFWKVCKHVYTFRFLWETATKDGVKDESA